MLRLAMLGLVMPIEVIGTFTFHIAEFAGVETNRLVELEGVGAGNVNMATTNVRVVTRDYSPGIFVDELNLTKSLTSLSRSTRQDIRCLCRRSHMTGRLDTIPELCRVAN